MSTPHFSLPSVSIDSYTSLLCANVDAPLFVTVRKYRLSTPLYRAQMATPNSTLSYVGIDSPHFSTVCKYGRTTFRYRA